MITKVDGKISKTMVFNGIALVLAVALPVLSANGYTGELPAEWSLFVPSLIALVNIFLRKVTNQPMA